MKYILILICFYLFTLFTFGIRNLAFGICHNILKSMSMKKLKTITKKKHELWCLTPCFSCILCVSQMSQMRCSAPLPRRGVASVCGAGRWMRMRRRTRKGRTTRCDEAHASPDWTHASSRCSTTASSQSRSSQTLSRRRKRRNFLL